MFPVLLIVAFFVARHSRSDAGGRGPLWFGGWALAGFLFSFSFITGLSVGLFILPLAAVALLAVARLSPHFPEATGFFLGVVATAILVALISAT